MPLTTLPRTWTSVQIPPRIIAPTPMKRVCVDQSPPATSTALSAPGGTPWTAARIGIATHQLSAPPRKMSMAMLRPTM